MNNTRPLNEKGNEESVLVGYQIIVRPLPETRHQLSTGKGWCALNGSYGHYYFNNFDMPSPHKYGLIKFRR